MTIGPAAMLAAGIFQAVGAIQQASASAKASKYNAAIAEQNATIARQQGEDAATLRQREVRARLGALRAAAGASGSLADDILADSAYQGTLAVATERYDAELRATGFQAQANLDRANARNTRTAGYIQAGTALASGYGDYSRQKAELERKPNATS